MKALAKVKLPIATPSDLTPQKGANSVLAESAMEQALFREQVIDSIYKSSAEKNMFQLPRETDRSHPRFSSDARSTHKPLFKDNANLDYHEGFHNEYDVSGLFKMADEHQKENSANLELLEVQKPLFQHDWEDAKDTSKIADSIANIDQLTSIYQDKFEPRESSRQNTTLLGTTFLKGNQTLNTSVGAILGKTLNTSNSQVANTFIQRKQDRKLTIDQSTMLPNTDQKAEMQQDSHIRGAEIDWSRFQMSFYEPQMDTFGLGYKDEENLEHLLTSAIESAKKQRSLRYTNDGLPFPDHSKVEGNFDWEIPLLNQDEFDFPAVPLGEPKQLTTIPENFTEEMYATLAANYQLADFGFDLHPPSEDFFVQPSEVPMLTWDEMFPDLEQRLLGFIRKGSKSKKSPSSSDSTASIEFKDLIEQLGISEPANEQAPEKVGAVDTIQCLLQMAMAGKIEIKQRDILAVSSVYLAAV